MKRFSEYIDKANMDNSGVDVKENNCDKNQNLNQEKVDELVDRYSKYSSDELMSEFIRMTADKKKRGELSAEEIENIKKTISPYLSDEQKINLEKVLNVINYVK